MRTLPIALLALGAPLALAACPGTTNSFSTRYSITPSLTSSVNTGTGYNYCKSIKTDLKPTCCTTATVNGFKDKADALVDDLSEAVATRDQFLIDRRGDVMDINDSLLKLNAAITKLSGSSNVSIDILSGLLDGYSDTVETFTEDFSTLKADFINYQKARQTCFNTLIKAQAGIWCLACLEDYDTEGYDSTDGVTYTDAVKLEIATACASYVNYAVGQSAILSLYYIKDVISTLADLLEKLANGDLQGAATEVTNFTTAYGKLKYPTDDAEKPVHLTGTCTTSSCAWLTDTVFEDGTLDLDLLALGGTPSSLATISSRRQLQAESLETPAGRNLAAWSVVIADESGIPVDFPQNPGNVDNNQNSAVRDGVVACAVAALAMLL